MFINAFFSDKNAYFHDIFSVMTGTRSGNFGSMTMFLMPVFSLIMHKILDNSSHAVRDLGRVRQYPPWLLFTTSVDSVGYPKYNLQKTRKQ